MQWRNGIQGGSDGLNPLIVTRSTDPRESSWLPARQHTITPQLSPVSNRNFKKTGRRRPHRSASGGSRGVTQDVGRRFGPDTVGLGTRRFDPTAVGCQPPQDSGALFFGSLSSASHRGSKKTISDCYLWLRDVSTAIHELPDRRWNLRGRRSNISLVCCRLSHA